MLNITIVIEVKKKYDIKAAYITWANIKYDKHLSGDNFTWYE